MALIRGAAVLHSVRYVRETFSPADHERVLRDLPRERCRTFYSPVREASWEPVEDLVAYMECAKGLLAPNDPAFFKSMGLFAGRLTRNTGFAALLGDPPTASRRVAVLWRAYYDTGRLELAEKSDRWLRARIFDFPARRPLCQRITGFWEGCFDADGAQRVHVEERACAADGAGYCEMVVSWA